MAGGNRWKLVGLEPLDRSVLPEGAYVLGRGENANGQRNAEGRVTSTYFSATLDRGIAMALVANGAERMGQVVQVSNKGGQPIEARIVDPVLYDKAGDKLNG